MVRLDTVCSECENFFSGKEQSFSARFLGSVGVSGVGLGSVSVGVRVLSMLL